MCVQVSRGFKLRMQTEFTCIFETQFRSQHFMFCLERYTWRFITYSALYYPGYGVRGTRTQLLICIGRSVHYWMSCAFDKGGFFFRDYICVDPHLPSYEAIAYVLPHFDALTHIVIYMCARRSSLLFVFVKHTYRSVFVSGLLNPPKRSTTWVKFYFGWSLHIFSMVRHCLWKMYATPGASINETGLFSSAAVVPQSKSTKLCSWVVVVPHKVNLTEFSV